MNPTVVVRLLELLEALQNIPKMMIYTVSIAAGQVSVACSVGAESTSVVYASALSHVQAVFLTMGVCVPFRGRG